MGVAGEDLITGAGDDGAIGGGIATVRGIAGLGAPGIGETCEDREAAVGVTGAGAILDALITGAGML